MHLERAGMPLHDAVGINCKNGATTKNQGVDVNYRPRYPNLWHTFGKRRSEGIAL